MDKRLTAHPAIAAMENRQATGSLSVIQGFAGSSSSDAVRIYPFLSLDRFVEIPHTASSTSMKSPTRVECFESL